MLGEAPFSFSPLFFVASPALSTTTFVAAAAAAPRADRAIDFAAFIVLPTTVFFAISQPPMMVEGGCADSRQSQRKSVDHRSPARGRWVDRPCVSTHASAPVSLWCWTAYRSRWALRSASSIKTSGVFENNAWAFAINKRRRFAMIR